MTNKSPLHDILHTLSEETHKISRGYMILFQRSIRQEFRIECNLIEKSKAEEKLYEKAGVLDPREAAWRDLLGGDLWMRQIMECLDGEGGILVKCSDTFVEKDLEDWMVLDLCSDALGWEEGDTQERVVMCPMYDLQGVMESLQSMEKTMRKKSKRKNGAIPIVFDSITPLVTFHGVRSTAALMEGLYSNSQMFSPLAVPVEIGGLKSWEHRVLEDISHAFLTLSDAHVHIFRKSHRGTGKVSNTSLPFSVTGMGIRASLDMSTDSSTEPLVQKQHYHDDSHVQASSKVTLKLHEGERSQRDKKPNIIVEHDDPEFDDWDEEDPDDDLDL